MNSKALTGKAAFQAAVLAIAFCAATAFGAGQKAPPPYEAMPVDKLESRTKDKTRCPGIFGDYWWANRFLDRHQQVEKLKGKTVDLVLLGDSIMHFWEWKHPANWSKLTEGRTVLNLGYAAARPRNDKTNALLKEFAAKHPEITWIDFNEKLVDATGWVPKELMRDAIHPSDAGYDIWMDAILPVVDAKAK